MKNKTSKKNCFLVYKRPRSELLSLASRVTFAAKVNLSQKTLQGRPKSRRFEATRRHPKTSQDFDRLNHRLQLSVG